MNGKEKKKEMRKGRAKAQSQEIYNTAQERERLANNQNYCWTAHLYMFDLHRQCLVRSDLEHTFTVQEVTISTLANHTRTYLKLAHLIAMSALVYNFLCNDYDTDSAQEVGNCDKRQSGE
jgi:hypothetical protein